MCFDVLRQLHEAVTVPPLVVVPRADFDESPAHDHCAERIDDAGAGIHSIIARDERAILHAENIFHASFFGFPQG